MKNKILLTGSLGFIASNLIRKSSYDKYNYSFVGVDKATYPKQLNNIYNGKIMADNYIADITDPHIVNNIFQLEQPEIIIHTATYQPKDNSTAEVKNCVDTNITGTKILLEACNKYKVSKFIYLSSDQLYPKLSLNSNVKHTELDNPQPETMLSISQLAAENLIINSGINYNILRLSNVYGPRQEASHFIPKIISKVLSNQKIFIEENGLNTYEWTHVFDVSSAILTILKEELDNQIINLSSGQECSLIEIVQFICNAMKSGHELIYCDADNQSVANKSINDNSKLITLDWKPGFKLRQGIQETCDWYQLNQYYLK